MSKLETNQVDPSTGTTLTLGTSGDTIAIPSGVTITNSGTANNFGGANTPAFSAYLSGNNGLSDNTFTKLVFNTEEYDSGSVFNTSNNRFTPGVVGKYIISAGASMDGDQSSNVDRIKLAIYKNGSALRVVEPDFRANPVRIANPTFSYLINVASTSDYFEIFAYISGSVSGSGLFVQGGATYTYFNGYKIIE